MSYGQPPPPESSGYPGSDHQAGEQPDRSGPAEGSESSTPPTPSSPYLQQPAADQGYGQGSGYAAPAGTDQYYGQPAPSQSPSYEQPSPSYGQPTESYGQSNDPYGQGASAYGQQYQQQYGQQYQQPQKQKRQSRAADPGLLPGVAAITGLGLVWVGRTVSSDLIGIAGSLADSPKGGFQIVAFVNVLVTILIIGLGAAAFAMGRARSWERTAGGAAIALGTILTITALLRFIGSFTATGFNPYGPF